MRRRSSLALGLLAVAGCLPIPHRETETVEVAGTLRRAGEPVTGATLSVERPAYVGPGSPGPCSGVAPIQTDAQGIFHATRRRRWRAWISLLGESPDWQMVTRLCIREGAAWRPLHLVHVNGWDAPLNLACDLAAPPRKNENTGEEGACEVLSH